ncbi:MAG: membrane protein insertase YidC [Bacteroidales bacterium]|nr:membrane protein insertase YidC [Bacteroidales bacterium]
MSRDNLIGLVLIMALLLAYSIWMAPSKEELEERKRVQDSLALVHQQKLDEMRLKEAEQKAQSQKQADDIEITEEDTDIEKLKLLERFGSFAGAASGEELIYTIESDLLRLGISSKGGRIVSAELKDFKSWDTLPLQLIYKDASDFSLSFFANNRTIQTNSLYFKPFWYDPALTGEFKMMIKGSDVLEFGMRAYANAGDFQEETENYIEFKYIITGNDYMTGLDLNFSGMDNVIDDNTNYLELDWHNQLSQQEKNIKTERNASTIHYRYTSEDMGELSSAKDASESLKTRVKWIAFKQQFFTTTLIAKENFLGADIRSFVQTDITDSRYLKTMKADISIPYTAGQSYSVPLNIYFGPTKYSILRQYKLRLERQIPLGWGFFLLQGINRYAVIKVFNFLEGFNLNYGIIILILTILLKIVLSPLTYKTYISQARMRVLKPEIEEINKKYPKKEDAMKKQQATMALYKKAGVNPMSGCVPTLIQLPILIAFFRFFPSSIELRQQSFLWAHDLSTYDSILDLPFNIPFYGDHVSLFTLLMAITTLIYTYVNNKMMDTGSTQMPGMKMMTYMMPIMFLGFFNSYSSGLSYYYMLTNLITFAQMFLIRRVIDEDKIRKKIMENKKKPVKVSSFQKRIEEMAKQRGYKP